MRKAADISGRRFGIWTVLGRAPKGKSNSAYWMCRCDCGTERPVAGTDLSRGRSLCCGCIGNAAAAERGRANTTHGMRGSREYRIWQGIKRRCLSEKDAGFPSYGGRGITMCPSWVNSFETFFKDMGSCPDGRSIDRIDNEGHYEPNNCRWATKEQQGNNKRSNVVIIANGRSLTLAEWSRETGIQESTMARRLHGLGWAPEHVVGTPPRHSHVMIDGEVLRIKEAAAKLGIDAGLLEGRIKSGWDIERAASLPRYPNRQHRVEWRGESLTIWEWSQRLGINYRTLRARILHRGMPIDEAMTAPVGRWAR